MRDSFSRRTIKILARRVGNRCSNPGCRKLTNDPQANSIRAASIGVAARITSVSEGGLDYDPAIRPQQRSHLDNGT